MRERKGGAWRCVGALGIMSIFTGEPLPLLMGYRGPYVARYTPGDPSVAKAPNRTPKRGYAPPKHEGGGEQYYYERVCPECMVDFTCQNLQQVTCSRQCSGAYKRRQRQPGANA